MYSILVYLLKPYTLACGVTGVAIVSLWRKRQVNSAICFYSPSASHR